MWGFVLAHSLIWMFSLDSIMLYAQEESAINRDVNGNNDSGIETRVVGGREAICEEFPYQINFIVDNSYFCGGFIINEWYIVTAAHCAQNVDPYTVVLRAGSSFRSNGTVIPIEEVTPYPEYDDPPFDKDIAVMKTAMPIEFNRCTQPIALTPRGETPRAGSIMTEGASSIPDKLMAVNLTVVARSKCEIAYPNVFTDNMICAGNFLLGGASTCQGDSGGVGAINGVAKGIVSFGRICGQPLAPSVFTDISSPLMRDFITNITEITHDTNHFAETYGMYAIT